MKKGFGKGFAGRGEGKSSRGKSGGGGGGRKVSGRESSGAKHSPSNGNGKSKGSSKGPNGSNSAVYENPFEARANRRSKFDVINRRVKGQNRNVAKARSSAIEKRKKTLLVDFKNGRKKNSFTDKRFGEDDPSMSLEDKMMLRFQKERQKRARKGAYNLNDDENENENNNLILTHGGRNVNDIDDFSDGGAKSDEDDNLDAAITKEMHFGGGFTLKKKRENSGGESAEGGNGENNANAEVKKSRQDILDEMIEKSKARKKDKAHMKEAQLDRLESLDKGFKDFRSELDFREKGAKVEIADDDEDYDNLFKEMAHESRLAKATDRTKTDEEVAKEEHEKLEELEKKRQARMNGEVDDEEEGDPKKNRKAIKEKEKEKRRATDDDLQADFEIDPRFQVADEGEEDDDEGEEEDEEEDEEDEDSEEEDEDDVLDEKNLDAFNKGESDEEDTKDGEEDEDEMDEDGMNLKGIDKVDSAVSKEEARKMHGITAKLSKEDKIPYVLPCPNIYEDLEELIDEYAEDGEDANLIIDRIRKFYSIKLGPENKNKVHNFYDILLKRFIKVGDQLSKSKIRDAKFSADRQGQLQFLTKTIIELTQDMPEVAGAIWTRLLGHMKNRVGKCLRDYSLGETASCWPSAGHLLLMRLLGHIFPTSDFRHSVVTPAMILLGQCLSQCPVNSAWDLAAGMFVSTLMMQYVDSAKRFVPEVFAFLNSVLYHYLPGTEFKSNQDEIPLPTLSSSHINWLRKSACKWKPVTDEAKLPQICLRQISDHDLSDQELAEVSVSVIGTIYRLLEHSMSKFSKTGECAFYEVFAPIENTLLKLKLRSGSDNCSEALLQMHLKILEGMRRQISKALDERMPLVWQTTTKSSTTTKSLNPKFAENFVIKKDWQLEQDKAKKKQLERQLKREKKGAIRELRRDAAFLDTEKEKRDTEKKTAFKDKIKANMAWLQQEQATLNRQVKVDSSLLKGGGSNAKKNANRRVSKRS